MSGMSSTGRSLVNNSGSVGLMDNCSRGRFLIFVVLLVTVATFFFIYDTELLYSVTGKLPLHLIIYGNQSQSRNVEVVSEVKHRIPTKFVARNLIRPVPVARKTRVKTTPPPPLVPPCDKYLQKIADIETKYQLLAMYDPGNCDNVPDMRQKYYPKLQINEAREAAPWGPNPRISDLCKITSRSRPKGKRLCQGMPKLFHFGQWFEQRYEYAVGKKQAVQALGEDCMKTKINLLIWTPNQDHKGGPRKVYNNLLAGLRMIGKHYYINDPNLQSYHALFTPDPHKHFLLYYMDKSVAQKFFIGPTVKADQFSAHRMSPAAMKYVHVVAASKQALNSNQYFPGMRLNKSRAVIYPSGIDERVFQPAPNIPRTQALLYVKNGCNFHVLGLITKEINKLNMTIVRINYGSYTETQFHSSLQKSQFAVVCDGLETQGIAMQEMMSMDVPLFVVHKYSVPYFSDQVGHLVDFNNIPLSFTQFYNKVKSKKFKPREWLVENLGLVGSAITFMKLMCGLPTQWNR